MHNEAEVCNEAQSIFVSLKIKYLFCKATLVNVHAQDSFPGDSHEGPTLAFACSHLI
jgi:hypothetical protein